MLECEFQLLRPGSHQQRYLILPAVLRDIDFIEGRNLSIFLQPFVKPTALVDRHCTDKKRYLVPNARLQDLKQVLHSLLGPFRPTGSVISQKICTLEPYDLIGSKEPDGLQCLNRPRAGTVGFLRIRCGPLDHIVRELLCLSDGLKLIEKRKRLL